MKNFIPKLLLATVCFFATSVSFAATRTWIGDGAGGAGTDLNNSANWTGIGPLLFIDDLVINMTVSGGGDAIMSADLTVNSITMSMNSGTGISTARIDANGFTLTVTGAASFTGTQFVDGSNWDFCELDAGSAGGGFVFNGSCSVQGSGTGDTHWEADITNPGTVTFRGDVTLGDYSYTTPGDEPDFTFDAAGVQTIACNQISSYTMGEEMTFGSSNTPTVNFTNFSWRVHAYESNTVIAANVIVDMADGGMDNFLGTSGTFTLGAGAEFRIGSTGFFPGDNIWNDYQTYSLDPTSITEFYGTNQSVKGDDLAYGHMELNGSGTKTSVGNFSVAGNFTNNVTFAHGSDIHTFNGTANQNINGSSSPTTFFHFVVNKASNTLTSDINLTIESILNMDAGTFLLDGETVLCNDQIDIDGGTLQITGGSLTQDEDSDTDFDQDGGTFDIDGGTVTLGDLASDGNADYNLDGGTLDISAGTLSISDELDMDGGTLNVSGTAVVNIAAHTGSGTGTADSKFDVSNGTVSITGGTINVLGAFDNTNANPAIDYNPSSSTVTGGTIVAGETGSDDESFFVRTNGNSINNFTVNKTTSGAATQELYYETFEDQAQGTETDAGATAWTTACTAGSPCGLSDGNSNDYFQVRTSTAQTGNRHFRGRDMDNEAVWTSQSINITGYTNVSISVDLGQSNYDNGSDYVEVYYSLDGGADVLLTNGAQSGAFADITATASGLSGNTIQVLVYMFNNGGNDIGEFDEVRVTGDQNVNATEVFLSDALDVNGNLTITAGTLDVTSSNNAVMVAGNWDNDGSFEEQLGTVTFDGSSPQQLTSGGSAETFYSFTMNNSSTGATINDDVNITNRITFTDGIITPAGSELVVVADNASALTASDASHVDGEVRKVGNDAFTFPVGNNGQYRAISISAPASGTDHFTAQYFNADPNPTYNDASLAGTLDHVSSCEYWILDRTNGSSNVQVDLTWDAASCGVTNLCELRVARWNGAQWTDEGNGGTSGNTTAGSLVSGNNCTTPATVNNFSPFTLASTTANNPLPVELLFFDAELNGDDVDLFWATATEEDNQKFIVERSADGLNFEPILEQDGAGNSTTVINYEDIDYEPLVGLSYYRLKQVDFDGDFAYSNVVTIFYEPTGAPDLSVYPNPVASDQVNVNLTGFGESEEVLLVLRDVTGRVFYSQVIMVGETGTQLTEIPLSTNVAAGVYLVVATSGDKKLSKKLIVK